MNDPTHPVPVVIVFPDSCSQPNGCWNSTPDSGTTDWTSIAPAGKFIVVTMFDIVSTTFYTPVLFNYRPTCGTGVCDDSPEVQGIVNYMKAHYAIDPSMIFAAGGSKGGQEAQEIQCDPTEAGLFAGLQEASGAWRASGNNATYPPSNGGSCPALLQPGTFTPAASTHPTMVQDLFSWEDTAYGSCSGAKANIAPYSGALTECAAGGSTGSYWYYRADQAATLIMNPAYGCSNTPTNYQNLVIGGTVREAVNTYGSCTSSVETQVIGLGDLNSGSGCHAYSCTGNPVGFDMARAAWEFWTTGTTTPS